MQNSFRKIELSVPVSVHYFDLLLSVRLYEAMTNRDMMIGNPGHVSKSRSGPNYHCAHVQSKKRGKKHMNAKNVR